MGIAYLTFERNVLHESIPIFIGGLALSLMLFASSVNAWTSPIIGGTIHSLLAFLSTLAVAWTFLAYRSHSTLKDTLFISSLSAIAVIQIGSAVEHIMGISDPIHLETGIGPVTDLFQILLIIAVLLIATSIENRQLIRKTRIIVASGSLFTIFASTGIFHFIVGPTIPTQSYQNVGITLGTLAVILGILSILAWIKRNHEVTWYDSAFLLVSFIFLTLGVIPLVWSLFIQSPIWQLGIIFQGIGVLLFAIAAMLPVQTNMGVQRRSAIAILLSMSSIALIPFFWSTLVESITRGFVFINLELYLASKLSAVFLSFVMVILLIRYSNIMQSKTNYPLILIFFTWGIVESHLVVFWRGDAMIVLGESLLPYIIGLATTIIILLYILKGFKSSNEEITEDSAIRWIGYRIPFIIIAIWVIELIDMWVQSIATTFPSAVLAQSILMIMGIMSLFLFTLLMYYIARKKGMWSSIEGISIGLLSLWIIPIILKGTSTNWSIGWWAAEGIQFVALLLGPVVIGWLYLETMGKAQDSHNRAALFSDILVHDITNMQQTILMSITLLESQNLPQHEKLDILEKARASLQHIERIIGNVRRIKSADAIGRAILIPTDLVDSIKVANAQLTLEMKDKQIELNIQDGAVDAYVLANELLVDVFYNLLKNAYTYSTGDRKAEVEIEPVNLHGDYFWKIRVIDYGEGINPTKRETLFKRFMKDAEGMGLGLSVVDALIKSYQGEISVEDRVAGDHTQGTVFILLLPAYVSHGGYAIQID